MSALDKQEGGTHYKDMPIQPIEFITKNKLDWYQGNIVKYASRHHNKGGADDLRKVIHYAELALEAQYGAPGKQAEAIKETKAPETITACDDGWIEWKGGKCPVGPDVLVEYVCMDGTTDKCRAKYLRSTWVVNTGDIIRYRVVK